MGTTAGWPVSFSPASTSTFNRPYGTQWVESSVFNPGTEVPGYFRMPRRGYVHMTIEPQRLAANLARTRRDLSIATD